MFHKNALVKIAKLHKDENVFIKCIDGKRASCYCNIVEYENVSKENVFKFFEDI